MHFIQFTNLSFSDNKDQLNLCKQKNLFINNRYSMLNKKTLPNKYQYPYSRNIKYPITTIACIII